jgi:hypothetical protein
VPDAVLVELAPSFGRLEVDYEIGHLLRTSEGTNYGIDFLPGSITWDPLVPPAPEPAFAADVVWFDAFVTNPDRTARNVNMLEWHGRTWLIDHGASLYFHHDWGEVASRATRPFEHIRDHVLLPFAGDAAAADKRARARLSPTAFEEVLAAVPDTWLGLGYDDEPASVVRERYVEYLAMRIEASATFVEEAAHG